MVSCYCIVIQCVINFSKINTNILEQFFFDITNLDTSSSLYHKLFIMHYWLNVSHQYCISALWRKEIKAFPFEVPSSKSRTNLNSLLQASSVFCTFFLSLVWLWICVPLKADWWILFISVCVSLCTSACSMSWV